MPDNRVIIVPGSVRMSCPELMFKPELAGKKCASIHSIMWNSVQASDADIRKDLCRNIVLSGDNTMYEGFADRLMKEISYLAPPASEIRVIELIDRKFTVWKGANLLASLSTFASSWVTEAEYLEYGPASL